MLIIETTDQLKDFCKQASQAPFITVDTEFMRERTYWPQLCLIQVAFDGGEAMIDPLVEDIDLKPLFKLLKDPSIVKVFHSGRHDIEIFYHLHNVLPTPVFDTQVAAQVCGFGESAGYETLVRKLLRKKMRKEVRFTNWAQRPLSQKQQAYALDDVIHLRDIYKILSERLKKTGRDEWLQEDMEMLSRPDTYDVRPEKMYLRIRSRSKSPAFLAIVRELAAWREEEAQRRNVPRMHFMRDEALLEIASHKPKTVEEVRGLRLPGRKGISESTAAKALKALEKGLAVEADDYPNPDETSPRPNATEQALLDLLRVLLKAKCADDQVAPSLVCSGSELQQLAMEDTPDIEALKGWRRKIFGEDALALKAGKIGLTTGPKGVVLIRL